MNARLIAGAVIFAGSTIALADVSTEAVPANDPSLRHNPAAIVQAGGANKAGLQEVATPTELKERAAYFDFNRTDVHTEDLQMLRAHAIYLHEHPDAHIKLVGHADLRGTPVYNHELAAARAESIRQYFVKEGIRPERIEVSSVGRADPATSKHTEPAMAKDRRVDIVYL